MGLLYKKIIIMSFLVLFIIQLSEARWEFQSGISATLQANRYTNYEHKWCPNNDAGGPGQDNYVVVSASTNFNFVSPPWVEYFDCKKVSSSQDGGMIIVNISSAIDVPGPTIGYQGFQCPADKPAVCGFVGGVDGKYDDSNAVDQLKCCAVKDIIVDMNDRIQIANVGSNAFDNCTIDHPIVCGAVNQDPDILEGIWCCAVSFEGDATGSCGDNIDNDHDTFKDCKDIDCNGKTSTGGKICEYSTELTCYDGFDNDGNGFTDFSDPACVCPAYNPSLRVTAGLTNGADGCCGDDNATTRLVNPLLDYGYVSQNDQYINQYLCYNNLTSLRLPKNDGWAWLDANDDPFKITTTNTTNNKQVDFISNSQEWFFCNATGNVPGAPLGKNILEFGSFDAPPYILGDEVDCYFALTEATDFKFRDGCSPPALDPPYNACCKLPTIKVSRNRIFDCFNNGNCMAPGIDTPKLFCDEYPEYCGSGDVGIGIIIEFLQKELCENQPQGCLGQNIYDPTLPCNKAQQAPGTNFEYIICNPFNQVCKNGAFVETTSSPGCCFGIVGTDNDVECINKPIDYTSCYNPPFNGLIFDPETQSCIGTVFWQMTGELSGCCAGKVIDRALGYNPEGAPESFMCFKYNGNNILSECGYSLSDLSNGDLISSFPATIGSTQKRISSTGSTIHLFENFDKVIDTNIKDVFTRMSFSNGVTNNIYISDLAFNSTAHYSFIEFDIAYSHKNFQMYFNHISGQTAIPVNIFNYLVDGDMRNRAHHVIIPLSHFPTLTNLYTIGFETSDAPLSITVDNIYFTPEDADLNYNSKNWYCSGGFGKWIDALEPDLNTYTWGSTFYSNWSQYGPYSFACKSYFAYAWTGHQCCGDDTRIFSDGSRNYGEFYNDTIAGCFNATRIYSDMSVSYIKGYEENLPSFEDYYYNDLLYREDRFIGCQVPNGKYSTLTTSYDGNAGTNVLFNSADNVRNQCAVNGSYYCFNNAWRQILDADGYTGGLDGLSFKSAPPGANIIKNGNFGG